MFTSILQLPNSPWRLTQVSESLGLRYKELNKRLEVLEREIQSWDREIQRRRVEREIQKAREARYHHPQESPSRSCQEYHSHQNPCHQGSNSYRSHHESYPQAQ
jgi:hypothetical protein